MPAQDDMNLKSDNTRLMEDNSWLQNSSLYQEFLAERQEILKHKWIESEKAGFDIGFERALMDWIRNHRETWRLNRRGSEEDDAKNTA